MCVRPCFAALNGLPPEVLRRIIEYLKVESKKSLREVCWFLHQNLGLCDEVTFKEWKLGTISAKRLRQFADEVTTVKGIQILELTEGSTAESDSSIEYLLSKHPELNTVRLFQSQCSNRCLQALFSHPSIEKIQLSRSNITGEIELAGTQQKLSLVELNLSGCTDLTNKGLACLLNWTNGDSLAELDISETNVSLLDFSSMTTDIKNLEVLNLFDCPKLTDSDFMSLFNQVGSVLKKLDLSFTNISFVHTGLLNISFLKLESIDLSLCCNLDDAGFFSFLNKVGGELKTLILRSPSISFVHVDSLTSSYPLMKSIDLSDCSNLNDYGFFSFLNKVGGELKTLTLRSTNISFVHTGSLNISFFKLESIDLPQCCNLDDAGFFSFLNKVGGGLKTLNLSFTNISFVHANSLTNSYPSIESIDLSYCSNLNDAGFFSFFNKMGGELKTLTLRSTDISFVHADSLTNSYPKIESIDLSDCSNLNDAGFFSFFNKVGGELKTLTLRSTNISFVHTDYLTYSYPKVESIDLSYCSNIDDAGIFTFLNKMGGELKTLNLSSTNISFVHANSLTNSYPKIESIDMSDCSNLDDAGFFSFFNKVGGELKTLTLRSTNISFVHADSLTNSYPKIESIDLWGCKNLDDAGFFSFFNKMGGELKTLKLSDTNISFVHTDSLTNCYPSIESIDLSYCSNLNDAGFFSCLNKVGGKLKTLILRSTNISFVHADSLTNSYPKIESIDLSDCSNLNDAGIFSFLNKVGVELKSLGEAGYTFSLQKIGNE